MSRELAVSGLLGAVVLIFLAATLFTLGHGLWLAGYRRWSRPRLAAAHAALNPVLAGQSSQVNTAALERLSPALRTRLLVDLSRNVSGETRLHLSRIAKKLGVLELAHRRLRSRFWWRRLHAARTLQRLDPEGDPYLSLLHDRNAAVRAQAAEWAAEEPAAPTAEALLALFGQRDSLSRFTAQDSLLRLGSLSVQPIVRYLSTHQGAEAIPALEVAVALGQPAFAAPAVELCRSAIPEVRRLAAELLGTIGGREGAEALATLLTDGELTVRAAAAHALGRIGHWPSAVAVAELLRDPEWEVRQAAGFALRSLGSPGELMLRRYRGDSDRFAADMARQILEIPAGVEAPA